MAGFLSARIFHVVTTEAVLLGDAISGLNVGVGGMARRSNCGHELLFVAKFETDLSPWDLWFVPMGKDVEGGSELSVRDHVRAHFLAVTLCILRPALGGWPFTFNTSTGRCAAR